jgi:hypothetical protein
MTLNFNTNVACKLVNDGYRYSYAQRKGAK